MSCKYCETFHNSESRVTYGSGENKITERFCLWARKMVGAKHPTCDEFSLSHLFWCNKNSCQMEVSACAHRQQTSNGLYPECKHCSQKREILELKRFAGLRKRRIGQIAETPFVPSPEMIPTEEPTRSRIIKRREM